MFVVDEHGFERIIELLSEEAKNAPETDVRLRRLLLVADSTILQLHFDRLFDYAVRVIGEREERIEQQQRMLLERVLEAESKKYTLMMVCEKLVDASTGLAGKYLLYLYLWRYLLMPSVEKYQETLMTCLKRATTAASEYRQHIKEHPALRDQAEQMQQQHLTDCLEALGNTALTGDDFFKAVVAWLDGQDLTRESSKCAFLRMWSTRQLTLQDAIDNKLPIALISMLYFEPCTNLLYSNQQKLSYMISIIGNQSAFRDSRIVQELTLLIPQIKFDGAYFRGHRMDNVLYSLMEGIGSVETVSQQQMSGFIRAVENISVPQQTQLLLWDMIEPRTSHYSFKAFCIRRFKGLVGDYLSKAVYQHQSWRLIARILQQMQELSVDCGGLLGELINFAVMLKLKLKKPVTSEITTELTRIRTRVDSLPELHSNSEFSMAFFRMDQFL